MKRAIFSFFTWRTSGKYSWWDDFPIEISRHLENNGIDHLCFYHDYTQNSKFSIGKRYKISHKQINNPFDVVKIIKPLAEKYDKVILHNHNYSFPSGLWALNMLSKKKFHFIITDHNGWFKNEFSLAKKNIRILLRKYRFLPEIIIGGSLLSKKRLQQIYGKEGVESIYNGINIPDIKPPEPLNYRPTKALFIGRLKSYKGLWPLVQAFKLMKGKTNVTLTIVGNGLLFQPLAKFIKENGLEKMILLKGFSANANEFYTKNHFIIIPSLINECFNLVSVEAQSYYLPCIYTNSGGLPETQVNYNTGVMVSQNNAEEIVEAIKYFQDDIPRFNQMRLAARQNSLRFTMDKMAKDYVNLYVKLIER